VRRREFTDEHCYLISLLLDEIGTSARTPALTLERYPDTPEYVATVWTPVGTACARLLAACPRWPPSSGHRGHAAVWCRPRGRQRPLRVISSA
jgi:hypothetical protein